MKKVFIVLLGLLCAAPAYAAFSDVPASDSHFGAVSELESANVIEGYSDGTFRPYQTINRAEFLKMILLSRYGQAAIDGSPINDRLIDVQNNDWYSAYVYYGLNNDIVHGYPDRTFRPATTINLVEALKIILETYDVTLPVYFRAPDHWYDPYKDAAASNGFLEHVTDTNPAFLVTRGDVAEILFAVREWSNNR